MACQLRESTGIPCPTCGSTRAWVFLLQGDVPGALALNPLATLVLPLFVVGGVATMVWVGILERRVPRLGRGRLWVTGFLGLVAAQWVYVILRGV